MEYHRALFPVVALLPWVSHLGPKESRCNAVDGTKTSARRRPRRFPLRSALLRGSEPRAAGRTPTPLAESARLARVTGFAAAARRAPLRCLFECRSFPPLPL